MAEEKSGVKDLVKEQTKELEVKYPREELISLAEQIFNVKPEVVTGALSGSNAQELTLSEVKQAVKEFLRKKVR